MPTVTRTCTECNIDHPATSDFFRVDSRRGTLRSKCKPCEAAIKAEYWKRKTAGRYWRHDNKPQVTAWDLTPIDPDVVMDAYKLTKRERKVVKDAMAQLRTYLAWLDKMALQQGGIGKGCQPADKPESADDVITRRIKGVPR